MFQKKKNKEGACSCHAPVALLTSDVPELKSNGFIITDLNQFICKIYTNRRFVFPAKRVVDVLLDKAGLSNTKIANDKNLGSEQCNTKT
jgi:hypothetical protein